MILSGKMNPPTQLTPDLAMVASMKFVQMEENECINLVDDPVGFHRLLRVTAFVFSMGFPGSAEYLGNHFLPCLPPQPLNTNGEHLMATTVIRFGLATGKNFEDNQNVVFPGHPNDLVADLVSRRQQLENAMIGILQPQQAP